MRRRRRRKAGARPELSIPQILAWADAQHQRTGRWPEAASGPVRGGPLGEKWRNLDTALRVGLRGLPGGSSLARLLAEHRHVRNVGQLPPLRRKQLLAWADAHHRRTGRWPNGESGPVADSPGETWRAVDAALRVGVRGLPRGSSLAQLLAQRRRVRNIQRLPRWTEPQLLVWADAHHRRTGRWPTSASGPVPEAPEETWQRINTALRVGRRGLAGKSSLARLLAERRGQRNPKQLPPLTVKQVLAWARARRGRTGRWPSRASGPIAEAPGETWSAVNAALSSGCRGLPAGMTLARLLALKRLLPRKPDLPRLSVPQILAWADAHYQRRGAWPNARSGPIAAAPGETWLAVDQALRQNWRGLRGDLTLARLLSLHRGVRIRQYAPTLTERQILAWADAYHRDTGAWPNARSGPVAAAPGETWRGIDTALRQACRGFRGGLPLARLLAQKRGVRNRTSLPRLELDQVLAWADRHQRRTATWPTNTSGPVLDAPGETWKGVSVALCCGYRGLPGGTSLAELLARERGARNRSSLPRLTCRQILKWAAAHHKRTGIWPNANSGPIAEASHETWHGVAVALSQGYRGLPGGTSLPQLLQGRRSR